MAGKIVHKAQPPPKAKVKEVRPLHAFASTTLNGKIQLSIYDGTHEGVFILPVSNVLKLVGSITESLRQLEIERRGKAQG